MTTKTHQTDWLLVKALLEQLKDMNAQKDSVLWTFAGTECEDCFVLTGKKLLDRIVREVGINRLIGITDYGFDGISDCQVHQGDFSNFVGVLDNLIKQSLSILNHDE